MKKRYITINALFNQIKEIDEGFLYLKSNEISPNEEILIVYEDKYTIPDEDIDGFKYQLGLDQVQDIIENLTMQIENPTLEDCIEAVNYYIKNDAFVMKEKSV